MSWAANNPEAYDEILLAGVIDKLRTAFKDSFGGMTAEESQAIESVAETIQQECPKAFSELVSWSNKEVSEAEASRIVGGV